MVRRGANASVDRPVVDVKSRKVKRGFRRVEEFAFFDEKGQRVSEWFSSIWPRGRSEFQVVEWKMNQALFRRGKRINCWFNKIGHCGAVVGESNLYLAERVNLYSRAKASVFDLEGKRLTPWLDWKEWAQNFSEFIYASSNFWSKLFDQKSEEADVVSMRRKAVKKALEKKVVADFLAEIFKKNPSLLKLKGFERALEVAEVASAVIGHLRPRKRGLIQ